MEIRGQCELEAKPVAALIARANMKPGTQPVVEPDIDRRVDIETVAECL